MIPIKEFQILNLIPKMIITLKNAQKKPIIE